MTDPVVQRAHQALAHHGRTFALASHLLPASSRDDAALLYALCRCIDDLADEAPDPGRARADLHALREHLRGALAGRPLPAASLDRKLGHPGTGELVAAWAQVAQRRAIPRYPLEALMAGVLTDTQPVRVADDAELALYCYRVAGTVGLLMCGVLGVTDPRALPLAVDLGVGMQLTNICRDVQEDAERGRVYLPADRLAAAGTSTDELLAGTCPRSAVARVVQDLLAQADVHYARGELGLAYLPARCRFAIRAAARMYRAIGVKLRRAGSDPLRGRTVVPLPGKLLGLVDAAMRPLPLASTGAP